LTGSVVNQQEDEEENGNVEENVIATSPQEGLVGVEEEEKEEKLDGETDQ
jgi:hypothetical protein